MTEYKLKIRQIGKISYLQEQKQNKRKQNITKTIEKQTKQHSSSFFLYPLSKSHSPHIMTSRQKQKSLLIDPSNIMTFNVSHQSIHMKKIKVPSISSNRNLSGDDLQSNAESIATVNTKIYYSVVEKESESGISFNDRLFFLKDEDVFGYMSKPDKNFDIKNAKETVPLKCLRKVVPKGKTLSLEFQVVSPKQSTKLIEKRWVLRMKDKKMADSWTDIINYQVQLIPSRKSTIERHESIQGETQNTDRKYQLQTAEKTSNYFSKLEEPIANERPEQDYVSELRSSSRELKTPRSVAVESKQIEESPVRQQYSNSSNQKVQQSPQRLAQSIYEKQQNQDFNSTSEKHSLKKQRYMSSRVHLPYQPQEFATQKSYYQQIQQSFLKKNKEMRQKLILPSFYNYFRPYFDQVAHKRFSARLEVDKKYEDFITYCELTAKQFVDKNDVPLGEFRLSNRYLAQKETLSKDKLFKEMEHKYEDVFGRALPKSMKLEALFLLFQNILYLELEDVQMIIPLAQLKTLPTSSDFSIQTSTSINKICQNSLITEFQNKEKNLQYVFCQITKHNILSETFLVPISCEVEFKGFNIFFRTKINQTLLKAATVYDSNQEISYIANGNIDSQKPDLTLDFVYEQLAHALYVNSELLESQSHFRIKPIRSKNLSDKLPTNNYKDFKYVIMYADILPQLQFKQVLCPKIFIKVHQNGTIFPSQNLKPQKNQQSSRKINLQNNEETSFIPSVLEQKSQSILKKKQGGKLPFYNQLGSNKQNDIQLKLYKEQINASIKQTARKLDRFDASIIHPYEINELIIKSSLNHLSLGKIYQEISGKNQFIRSLIKSEIAAECSKLVLFKKCQQILMTQKNQQDKEKQRDEISMRNVTTLLNLILGKPQTKQTELIWKVLTLHSQMLYSMSISQKDIHKGYLILALASKLNMMINPNSSSVEEIFNNDKFIVTIKFQSCKIKPVNLISSFLNEIQETQVQELLENKDLYFRKLNQTLSISTSPLPYYVKRSKTLYNKILLLLTEKISPNNMNFTHLNIYQPKQLNFTQILGTFQLIEQPRTHQTATSLIKQKQQSLKRQSWEDSFVWYYRRKLKQLQYKVAQRNSFNLEQQIDSFMKELKVFYQHHPIMSEFLQFMADYRSMKGEYQKAIDYLKASLSNIISVCEGNSNHVKLASCFLKISQVYQRMGKFDEALNQLKRSKHCLQINKEDASPMCAHILLKIAKITLQIDGKVNEALIYVFAAEKILELESNMYSNVQMLIDAYETESKCLYSSQIDLNSLRSSQNLDRITRSQHYFETLERIMIRENQISKANNFGKYAELITAERMVRIFKLVLPIYFNRVSQKGGEMLMTYMCELSQNIARKGGVDYTKPEMIPADSQKNQRNQLNSEPQIFFYPIPQTNRSSVPYEPQTESKQKKQSKSQYNFHQAFIYVKKQIYTGEFIMQLMEFMQKSEQILTIIKRKVKQNILNRSHSQSSSRMYLMSTKGADEWDADLNEGGKRNSSRRNSQHKDQLHEDIDLEKLLDYSKEIRSSADREITYSQRQRKFDSLMRALMVLLGDGFMLHVFEE